MCDEDGDCDCESFLWQDNGKNCNTFSEIVLIGGGVSLCLLIVIVVVIVILVRRRSNKNNTYQGYSLAEEVDDELIDY